MLKFLLDENVRIEIKEFLKSKGLEVEYIPKGISNSEAIALAKEKQAVLLTHDKGFLDANLYPPEKFSGIVVIDIPPSMLKEIICALEKLLGEVKEFSGKSILVEVSKFRIVEGSE